MSKNEVRSRPQRDDSVKRKIEPFKDPSSPAPQLWVKRKNSRTWRPVDESGLLPLPKLPPHWVEPGRSHWVLGWAPSPSKYAEALRKGWGIEAGPTMLPSASVYVKLKYETGYEHFIVIAGKPDAQAEADGVVTHVLDDIRVLNGPKTPIVSILGIVSTGSARLFTRRPTQKQYDFMVRLLGEPRWIECAEPKKGFKLRWLDD